MAFTFITPSSYPLQRMHCALWMALLIISPTLRAEQPIVVVTNIHNPIEQLTKEEVAELFLGKRKFSQEHLLVPIDSDDDQLREQFYQAVAEMSTVRVKAYWSRIVFSGQGRPPQEISSTEAYARLKHQPDLLVYLPKDQVTEDMKIVFSIP